MERSELKGKIQSVLGVLDGNQLGFTLPHEHCYIDLKDNFKEPTNLEDKEYVNQPVSLENLSWVRLHKVSNLDNLRCTDEELITNEFMLYKKAGGSTIVTVTPRHIDTGPVVLARIAKKTGINVIMGTGCFIGLCPPEMHMDSKTAEEFADDLVRDITIGINGTDIRAGIIGEIGCSWPLTDGERKILHGVAIAQQQTGVAVTVHPGMYDESPLQIVNTLGNAGVDPGRIVIDHMGRAVKSHSARFRLAQTGCYLEWDLFGSDGQYPIPNEPNQLPDYVSDAQRIDQIIQMIGEGHLNQVLISHDTALKTMLASYGGVGYAHIPKNVVPLMKAKGISEEQIHTITIENPKRMLIIV